MPNEPTTVPDTFSSLERILAEALSIYSVQLYAYGLMPYLCHLVLRPTEDGAMSRLTKWVGGTHTMRSHAHHHTGGAGHVYQQRFRSFPIQDDKHFLTVCRYVERNASRAGLFARTEDWH